MSHFIAISVGPVQEFIAAARRTRDLWFGSYLLSEISRAVAQELAKHGSLIFPASLDAENVANVILAELPSGEPRDVAARAKQAAKECWKRFAQEARSRVGNAIVDTIWSDQIDGVIEFYAAWVLHSDPEQYADDRKKLMRLLAGRKSCRDYASQKFDDQGIPKSSLDGQRPSVFVQPQYRSQRDELRAKWPKVLRLTTGEELDIIGVVKRVGKKRDEPHPSYSSVARIAAETWLCGKRNHPRFEDFSKACSEVPGLNCVAEQAFSYFPFEGTVVFKDRHPDLVVELGPEAKPKLETVAKLLKEFEGEPSPYLAVLVADGDNMGAAIAALGSPDAHRAFSSALAGFATQAQAIVEKHSGVLVYAGGDDVLAFLPVDRCLECARKLHHDFGDRLQQYTTDNGKSPTLSVGIAIGHFMENLEDLLEYGRAAEKAAKKVEEKDALAVHLHKRGGAPIKIASRWETRPEEQLHTFAHLIRSEAIPNKLPYELQKLAATYQNWPEETVTAALVADVVRVIRDKQPRSGRAFIPEIESLIREKYQTVQNLLRFAQELLVAKQIAVGMDQANEPRLQMTPREVTA